MERKEALPTHARLELVLQLKAARSQLWWEREQSVLAGRQEEEDDGGGKKKRAGRAAAAVSAGRWLSRPIRTCIARRSPLAKTPVCCVQR